MIKLYRVDVKLTHDLINYAVLTKIIVGPKQIYSQGPNIFPSDKCVEHLCSLNNPMWIYFLNGSLYYTHWKLNLEQHKIYDN